MPLRSVCYLLFLSCLLLESVGCSRMPKPSTKQLRESVVSYLPPFMALESFSIKGSEDLGTTVEPAHLSRFEGAASLSADTYRESKVDDEVTWIARCNNKGTMTKFFGKTASRMAAGQWQTEVSLEGNPIDFSCKPLEACVAEARSAGRMAVIEGSPEAQKLLATREQKAQTMRKILISHAWVDHANTATAGTMAFGDNGAFSWHNHFLGGSQVGTWSIDFNTISVKWAGRDGMSMKIVRLTPDVLVIQGNPGTLEYTR